MGNKKEILIFIALIISGILSILYAQETFYNYYSKGLEYMKKRDYNRAIEEFRSAISLEFEDSKMKRTYGTRFIKYFPHRELGIAYYYLGDTKNAEKELKLSLSYKKSKRALQFLKKIENNEEPSISPKVYTEKKPIAHKKPEKKKTKITVKKKKNTSKGYYTKSKKVPEGALTYDPAKVTQVGSRLSVAVLPFDVKGKYKDLATSFTDKMITQLVDLRRFRVIERNDLEKVMKEQSLGLSGMIDEKSAVNAGKLVGADVIIIGSVVVEQGYAKVYARVINTETGELIVAKEATSKYTSLSSIEKLVGNVAIMIYNDLPLVEGSIIKVENDTLYLDIGSEQGIRKGTKCIIYQEGEEIIHPVTKEVLGRKVKKLGEAVIKVVQSKMSIAQIIKKSENIKIGDKVVLK